MNNYLRATAIATAMGAFLACGDRTVPDESNPLPPPDIGSAPESEGDSEGEVICREGLAACEGECVDLQSDDAHCGGCGHGCKDPWFFGECVEGRCPSAFWCGTASEGLETCKDVCAAHGQTCDEGPRTPYGGCGGSYGLYFDRDALERCEARFAAYTARDATCTTPIDWSIDGGWEGGTAQAVSCCCTQDLPR